MDILRKNKRNVLIALFVLYNVLIWMLVVKSIKCDKNDKKTNYGNVKHEYEIKVIKDEAEKVISEEKKAYYEYLYNK